MAQLPARWRGAFAALRVRIGALYLALADRRVPRLAKIIIIGVVAYALSPLDLIPDVIPILGWLDELVILPLGVWLAVRLIPAAVWNDCLSRASRAMPDMRPSRGAAAVIVVLWLASAAVVLWFGWRWWRER